MTSSAAIHRQQVDRIKASFYRAFRPPSPLDEITTYCKMALADLENQKLTQVQRHNSAIRLLCSIPAISDRLTTAGANEIYGRQGVMQKSAV